MKTVRSPHHHVALFVVACLGGCLQLPTPAEPVGIVAPQPAIVADPAWQAVAWSLAIARPITDQTRGSVRIVVRTPHSRLSFYPGIAWLDEMPDMLQALLLQAFIDSGRIGSVARPGAAQAAFTLTTEVRRFEAVEVPSGGLRVELQMQAGLVETRSGRMLASRVFEATAPVAGGDVRALTGGFEAALESLISGVVGWALGAQVETTTERPVAASSD
jgi:cholesterol transport system auxiliary component